MHGSSSVPQDWLEIINNHGGDMGQTYGVPVNEIVEDNQMCVWDACVDFFNTVNTQYITCWFCGKFIRTV
jgi:hypothetical protein